LMPSIAGTSFICSLLKTGSKAPREGTWVSLYR
jgi:hypothetical protein